MDIIKKINLKSVQASYESIGLFNRLGIILILISLVSIIVPHDAYAEELPNEIPFTIVFETGDHTQYLSQLELNASFQYRHETAVQKLQRQLYLGDAVKKYLEDKRSPLAEYSSTIVQLNNWKKILALANAESTMCRFYIEEKANCWGVGGSDLWDMGHNLGEGVVSMNYFLNNYPNRSPIKYANMDFEHMNGLYKQPARDHWLYNNLVIYNELTELEQSIYQAHQ